MLDLAEILTVLAVPLVVGLTALYIFQVVSEKRKDSVFLSGPTASFFKNSFSFEGRMARKSFLLTNILFSLFFMVFGGLGWVLVEDYRAGAAQEIFGGLLIAVSLGGWVYVSWATSAKRMRDTGVIVWWVLVLLIPLANVACAAFLLLVPTDEFSKGRTRSPLPEPVADE